jgi:hypothetical protein
MNSLGGDTWKRFVGFVLWRHRARAKTNSCAGDVPCGPMQPAAPAQQDSLQNSLRARRA